MSEQTAEQLISGAEGAVVYAQSVRAYHARRTNKTSKQRQTDIKVALDRLRTAMRPLRRRIARYPYGPQTEAALAHHEAFKAASRAIQSERRKLWKMLPNPTKEA